MLHLAVLKSQFVNDNRLTVVRKPIALAVDVLIVSVADDFAVRKFEFASTEELYLIDLQGFERLRSSLSLAFACHGCVQRAVLGAD